MFNSSLRYALLSASVLGLVASSGAAQAAGFYIQEQSVKGLGSAFSGSVTNLNDPSTVYFNPAGLTKTHGTQAQLGAHLLVPSADLTNTGSTESAGLGGGDIVGGDGGNPYDPTPVPNAFLSYQYNDQLWAGLGITAPFGLANEYDEDWFGRYDSIKTELTTIDVQPTIAYKVNDQLSIGAGVNVQFVDAELTSAVADTAQGISKLEGDDWSWGYTLGVQYQPLPSTVFGASYRSAISHTLEGRASVSGSASNDFSVNAEADLELPDIATFGAKHALNDKLTIQGQATWFGWNNFQDITAVSKETFTIGAGTINAGNAIQLNSASVANIQNYQTTWAFAVGAEYDYSDDWTFRAGVQLDETPTTDEYRTTRTPDGDRTWLSTGATYKLNDKFDIDLAATYIWIEDQEINVNRNNTLSAATVTDVKADTEGSVGIFAVGVTYKF